MQWLSLPDPLGFTLELFAQTSPGDGSAWVVNLVSGMGSAGVAVGVLWKIHQDHVKRSAAREDALIVELAAARAENGKLTSRLFLLADRGMAVGLTASEVVKSDAADGELTKAMQRVEALLQQRGGAYDR